MDDTVLADILRTSRVKKCGYAIDLLRSSGETDSVGQIWHFPEKSTFA